MSESGPMMTVNAKTELYGVVGNPVEHSLSPLIHNTAFKKLGLNAVYVAFPVDADSLGLALEAVRSLGVKGVNVTIPFKEEATHYVDEIPEDHDRAIGAVNTIVNREGMLYGYNTDGPGFLWAVAKELRFNPRQKQILVLGAGGAARGVAFSLAGAGVEKLWVYNRTRDRAEGLADYVGEHFPDIEVEAVHDAAELRGAPIHLVVNATAAGMNAADPAPFDLSTLSKKPAAVYDLVYKPAETPLLKQAKKMGIAHAGGLGMLAAQAALSFELWTGKKDGVREAMLEALKK